MFLLVAVAIAAAPPHGRDDDDDRPRRRAVHVVRHEPDDDDEARDKAKAPIASAPTLAIPVESSPTLAPQLPISALPSRNRADPDDADEQHAPDNEITVTARRLDAARAAIEPAFGSATYTLGNETVENRPGGETRSLGSILVQAPGVGRDARGTLVVRGASGGLQYRLNNIILPEGAGDFGEALSARLAEKTELITGALPAQYGLAPGGVVNVTTKNGHYLAGGQAELYGGAHATLEPAVEWGHAAGPTSLFLSGSLQRSRLGLPAPDARNQPLHDRRRELEGFAFLDHVLNEESRVSLIAGSVNERQQIPALAVVGIAGAEGRLGVLTSRSHYAIAAYQLSNGPLSLQASLSGLAATRAIAPDEALRLAVDGRSFGQRDRRRSAGTQVEASYAAGANNVFRGGLIASTDRLDRSERTATRVGALDRSLSATRSSVSLFVQDQWTLTPQLTANLGLRADRVGRTDDHTHLQPRASVVWTSGAGLTAHANYARSVVAAPLDDVASEIYPLSRVERDDLFSAGVERKLGGLTLGIELYDRHARDFIATRWRADAPVGEAFSYASARLVGMELVMTYAHGPLTAWGNLARSRGTARGLTGGISELTPSEAAYVATHRVPLDTDQHVILSAGASYHFASILVSASLLAGSGPPRSGPEGSPNGTRGPGYATADLAGVWHFNLLESHPTDLRIDLRNLTNRRELLSDGTGLARGAPSYNEARGLYIGLEQSF